MVVVRVKTLVLACGLEEVTDLKPDHVAVKLSLQLDRLSPGFQGQRIYEEPQISDKGEVEIGYLAARANKAGAWILGLQERNVDELFDLAYLTEERSAAGQHQAGVFLDLGKCYERVPLHMLEELAIESGYPLYALNVALNMYSGNRCILVQGAVSDSVTATCGLPLSCGHAVDMLHAFLIRSLKCAGRMVEVLASLKAVNMRVNAFKTVVICNGSVTKRTLWKVWRAGRLPPIQITTRVLEVDTQWFVWRNPV
eukprot:3490676-Amphidinium_carterae.2